MRVSTGSWPRSRPATGWLTAPWKPAASRPRRKSAISGCWGRARWAVAAVPSGLASAEESMTDDEAPGAIPGRTTQGDVPESLARALVAVRGLDSDDAVRRVHAALAAVPGVHDVAPGDGGKMV